MSRTPGIKLVTLVLLGVASPALAGELVFNGGFETGNFSGWFVPPNVPPGPNGALFRVAGGGGHSGNHYAGIASTQLQFISQILPTQAGQDYELSFWLRRPLNVPGPFTIRWEGAVVFSQFVLLPDSTNWHQFTLPIHSNITASFLEFGQMTFPNEFQIDDISVVPVPPPSVAAVMMVGGAVVARRRLR
jgi:hypothetical protein